MRGLVLFASGVVAGILIMQPSVAQPDRMPGIRLNHVGVFAKNFEESYNFYTKTLGFPEAFRFANDAMAQQRVRSVAIGLRHDDPDARLRQYDPRADGERLRKHSRAHLARPLVDRDYRLGPAQRHPDHRKVGTDIG